MPYVVKPIDRNQVTMNTLDAMVEWDSIARVIDCFVDHLDLKELGFEKTKPSFEGRPCYDPQSLLKLYLYGYRKTIRSSRKLAAACITNIEVMWMLGGLRPDFRTISDFRKDNIDNLKGVFKEFLRRVTVDLETGYVSIDGSKFKAWNGKDRNFTIMKLDDRIKWLEDHTQEYLRLIDEADGEEEAASGTLTKEDLEAKLQEYQERLERYRSYRELMERENLTQISLTDADARLMKNKNGMDVSYNIQTAVDSETHLIMDYQETNQVTDHGLLVSTMEGIRQESEGEIVEVIADKGYDKAEDMIDCLEQGIIPNVILPDGQDTYELEIDYREIADPDSASTEAEDLKNCLHAGVIPDAYEGIIEDMEVVEVRRKVLNEPEQEVKSPYGTEEEMKDRAAEGYFVRDPERDLVYCPGGETLRKKCIKKNGVTRYANKQACQRCPYRDRCINGKGITRWKELDFSKDCLEKKAKWWNPDEPDDHGSSGRTKPKGHFEKKKVVRFKLRPDRSKMEKRMCTSEHPFGTIKRTLDAGYFLLKSLRKIGGEFSLMATGYNLSGAENLFSFDQLMELVGVR
ncbi:MAG: transposase [Parasporobacterium sp.]|nr:transposase [Parasporobacterium sp.]